MKIDRLIGIITLLLQREQVTAPELARRFEVSRRTINRDVEDICRAGIPLVTTQGYHGGISIAEGYKLDRALLTEEELQAVLAGLKGLDSVSSVSRLSALVEKLSRKERRVLSDDVILIDLASHYQHSLTRKIETIKQAVYARRLISFRYYYKQGETHRTIEPYRLLFKWSNWYVWGYCQTRRDFRLFKLNRLWDLEIGAQRFTPRALPLDRLEQDRFFLGETVHLRARFAPSEKYRLVEEYGPDSFQTGPDGTLSFQRDFVSYEAMREWILSFGDRAEVLEPQSLRRDLRAQAGSLLSKYEET